MPLILQLPLQLPLNFSTTSTAQHTTTDHTATM